MFRSFSMPLSLAIGMSLLAPAIADAATTEITSPIGNFLDNADDPYWATKGYRLTPSENVPVVGLEWFITLPVGTTIEARIYDAGTQVLLASGTAAAGDGSEQWYRSDVVYELQPGTQYIVAMYHSNAAAGLFDRMNNANMDFSVLPLFTGVRSVSNNGGSPQSDVFPSGDNTWAPFMRVIHGGCGDLVLDPGEMCDDGNVVDGDGCSADCNSDETCGNGVIDISIGELCDDANVADGDGCSADCLSDETCGNGIADVAIGEVCDDANMTDGDGCSADCLSDETCGNGIIDVAAGELCDDANAMGGDGCSDDCTSDESCGNGIVDIAAGEACDDANTTPGDGCSADCLSDETCGNGILDDGEECDDGEANDPAGPCDSECMLVGGGGSDSASDGGTGGGTGQSDDTGGPGDGGTADPTNSGTGSIDPSGWESFTGGGNDVDTGCGCVSSGRGPSGALWSLLGLFGLGALRRRRA